MAPFDLIEDETQLVLVPSRAGAVKDIVPLAVLFLVPAVPLTLLLAAFDDVRGLAGLLVLGLVVVIVVLAVSGFLLAMQVYRRHRLDGRLVLDRAADEVRHGSQRVGALSEVAAVELRRVDGRPRDRWELALVRAGAGELARVGAADARGMRALAERVARYAGTRLELKGVAA